LCKKETVCSCRSKRIRAGECQPGAGNFWDSVDDVDGGDEANAILHDAVGMAEI